MAPKSLTFQEMGGCPNSGRSLVFFVKGGTLSGTRVQVNRPMLSATMAPFARPSTRQMEEERKRNAIQNENAKAGSQARLPGKAHRVHFAGKAHEGLLPTFVLRSLPLRTRHLEEVFIGTAGPSCTP